MSHSDAEIRELLRNLRKPDKLDLAYPITATEDDLVALIEEQTRLARKDELERTAKYAGAWFRGNERLVNWVNMEIITDRIAQLSNTKEDI